MRHESNIEDEFNINFTEECFDYWINQSFITDELKNELKNADILLIPQIGFRDIDIPVFPVKTEELFTFLRKKSSDVKIDICIEDKDYRELALHYDLITIGAFVVTSIALPVLVNLLSDYIKSKISLNSGRVIKVSLIVENKKEKTSKKISYEGKPENFDSIIKSIENLWEE